MTRFRSLKSLIRPWLKRADWSQEQPLPPEAAGESLPALINPLFACLTEGGEMTDRAAFALGDVLSRLYEDDPELAKNAVRRFIWHMNEESGNIGWGIPEAFGEALIQSRPLADAYHKVLFSYIRDLEGDSTYCDYAPLRRSCYRAIGRVAEAWPDLAHKALPLLDAAKHDPDEIGRRLAEEWKTRLEKQAEQPA